MSAEYHTIDNTTATDCTRLEYEGEEEEKEEENERGGEERGEEEDEEELRLQNVKRIWKPHTLRTPTSI